MTTTEATAAILHTFDTLNDGDNLVSLARLRSALNTTSQAHQFIPALTELRRANILCLSSADRYLSDADRAAGIHEFGEVLTHVSRVQN